MQELCDVKGGRDALPYKLVVKNVQYIYVFLVLRNSYFQLISFSTGMKLSRSVLVSLTSAPDVGE